jgi:hypothetical protein
MTSESTEKPITKFSSFVIKKNSLANSGKWHLQKTLQLPSLKIFLA